MPFADVNALFDALVPRGLQHYWKAAFLTELTDDAIAAHFEHGPGVPAMNSTMHIYPINGACHDVAEDATAFGHRDASFATVIAGMWPDPADNEANSAASLTPQLGAGELLGTRLVSQSHNAEGVLALPCICRAA